MTDELARAHATLCRGADVFGAWLDWPDAPFGDQAIAHGLRSKVVGNGLRELDRFLNILIDQIALRHGFPAAPRQWNTANKLSDLSEALGWPDSRRHRLLALGRSRDCLFYCGGVVKRGDTAQTRSMTLGWPDGRGAGRSLRRLPMGSPILLDRADFESVRRFYRQIAAELLRAPGAMSATG